MPAGKKLILQVESRLDPVIGKTMDEIRLAVSTLCTPRAIRYAVTHLIEADKAFKRGRLVFAKKDLLVDIVEGENAGRKGVPLAECFPDLGYLDAKADLLIGGEHRGGGGAAPAFRLKLSEAA